MIKYLENKEIDRNRWDISVQNSSFEIIYSYSWYLDLVSKNWSALVEDDYQAIMPVTWKRKYGIWYLYQPLLTQQLGIFSERSTASEKVKAFLQSIPDKFWYVDICLNKTNEFSHSSIRSEKRINYELLLNAEYTDLYKNYSTNTKRNLKKASEHTFELKKINVEKYLELKLRTGKGRFISRHIQWLGHLLIRLMEKGCCEITGYYTENRLCAAAVWAYSGSRIIYLNGVSDNTGKETRAMFVLVDETIRERQGSEKTLDFEGSVIPGVARFFAGFGADPIHYLHLRWNRFPVIGKKIG